ncbi:MAG: 50S ribosomal protein L23 [Proteobacteria bacterium]|nr:50S ribosomal protein L23 [Pseudomonadota bacterium]
MKKQGRSERKGYRDQPNRGKSNRVGLYDVIIAPVLTEKSRYFIQSNQVYTFFVHHLATKGEVINAVESLWDVKVLSVNTLIQRGKVKRTLQGTTKKTNRKKAMVKLIEGDTIPVFNT